jgi:hypothetical protein
MVLAKLRKPHSIGTLFFYGIRIWRTTFSSKMRNHVASFKA